MLHVVRLALIGGHFAMVAPSGASSSAYSVSRATPQRISKSGASAPTEARQNANSLARPDDSAAAQVPEQDGGTIRSLIGWSCLPTDLAAAANRGPGRLPRGDSRQEPRQGSNGTKVAITVQWVLPLSLGSAGVLGEILPALSSCGTLQRNASARRDAQCRGRAGPRGADAALRR